MPEVAEVAHVCAAGPDLHHAGAADAGRRRRRDRHRDRHHAAPPSTVAARLQHHPRPFRGEPAVRRGPDRLGRPARPAHPRRRPPRARLRLTLGTAGPRHHRARRHHDAGRHAGRRRPPGGYPDLPAHTATIAGVRGPVLLGTPPPPHTDVSTSAYPAAERRGTPTPGPASTESMAAGPTSGPPSALVLRFRARHRAADRSATPQPRYSKTNPGAGA